MDGPILTERLRLRPFREDDLAAVHALWSDPEVSRWVGGGVASMAESAEELERHMRHQERHGFGMWAVDERDGRLIGEVGLQYLEGRGPEVEVGWALLPPAWGAGYAQEAARAWLDVGFGELGLDRIIAVVLPGNERSRRVCDRLGMREIGTRLVYKAEHVLYEITRRRGTPAAAASSAAPR